MLSIGLFTLTSSVILTLKGIVALTLYLTLTTHLIFPLLHHCHHVGEEDINFEESGSAEDNEFDTVVGALEEILLGESFTKIQKGFCDEHCGEFHYYYNVFFTLIESSFPVISLIWDFSCVYLFSFFFRWIMQ